MKQTIKIFFVDFWQGFDKENNFIVDALSNEYQLEINPQPDYLFFSSFGNKHFEYKNCIKIYYTGENDVPDFNLCDYAIGFHHLNFEDRYFRLPLYVIHDGFKDLKPKSIDKELALNRKFCNFVYTNNKFSDPFREKFFHQLSKYKKVDSGGRFLNNIGKPVPNKITFIKDYKFTIAFENSLVSGYTTEKIFDPMRVNSMPVYWGNLKVGMDFNKQSFVCVNDFESIEQAVEEIIRLDNDDDAYLQKLSQPWLNNDMDYAHYMTGLKLFLKNIIEQPINQATRTALYGFAKRYLKKQKTMSKVRDSIIGRFF